MPWPTYTERLLHAGGAETATTTVPVGERWVVKCILAATSDPPSSYYMVYIHGHELVRFVFLAPQTYNTANVTAVAYAGEEVRVVSGGTATRVTLEGFVFTDTQDKDRGPELAEYDPPSPSDWHEEVRRG